MIRPGVLLRFISHAVLTWLVLAIIWMTLPSPLVKNGPDLYVTKQLKGGKNLIRVYEVEDFFPYDDQTRAVQSALRTGRQSFILDYHLDIPNRTLWVGDTAISLQVPEKALHVSEPISVLAKTADQDGINPPWFWRADATLLYWWIHRDNAVLPLRVKWTATYAIELWPESQYWLSDSSQPKDLQPLLTIESLYDEDPELFWAFAPKAPISTSPSRTYPLRVALLTIIAPTGLLVYSIFSALGSLFSISIFWLILVVALVVLWYTKAKPRLKELRMAESFRNIYYGDESLELVADAAEDGTRPFSLTWQWFVTTRSPLDDILRSFETTRYFTRPLSFRRQSMDGAVAADGSEVSDVDSERTLRADEDVSRKYDESGADIDVDLEKGMS